MSNRQQPGYPPGQGHGPPQGYGPIQSNFGPPAPLPPDRYRGWKIAGAVFGGLVLLRACGSILGFNPEPPPTTQSDTRPAPVAENPKPQSEPRPAQQPRPQPKAVDEERPMVVPLGELLGNYKDNEVRSDAAYKGKLIQTTGLVGDVKKDILGDIYVTVGTGAAFEIPTVQCFFEKDQEQAVAALSKGNKITVKGRVSGLMMNVLVKRCGLVQ